jgi:glycosyltransferase involved in cell wall biosynthesis
MGSLGEGCPNAILEAMATGLPVVATHVGGIPEMVIHGETGFLVPPRDPPRLAEGILRVVQQGSRTWTMGARAREVVASRFTLEQMVRRTEAVLAGAVSGSESSADGDPPPRIAGPF